VNATTPEISPVALSLAHGNAEVLRVLAQGAATSKPELARGAGVDPKNIGRTLSNLEREGLIAFWPEGLGETPRVGCWGITVAGRHALQVADFAAGRTTVPAGEGASASDLLLLRHDELRPSPLNPRRQGNKGLDEASIAELADTIEAAGDVLQNLVVFPADETGIHDIFAGERRWRAVGLLIEQGRWPIDRRLRCLAREATPGQTQFLALIENGQRENLSLIEEARAYETLIAETGWSARHAAHQCGRDARTVQQMLQVLREARPQDLAAHEADPRTHTWEWLRDSVKAHREREAGDQVDLEEVTGPANPPPWRAERFSEAVREAALAAARLTPGGERIINPQISGTTTIEGETWPAKPTESMATAWDGYPRARIELTESDSGRFGVSLMTQAGGPSYSGQSSPPYVHAGDPIFPTRADALAYAAERIVERLGDWGRKRKLTAWLASLNPPTGPHVVNGVDYGNATRAAEARRAAGLETKPKANYGGGSGPASPAADEQLLPVQAETMAEVANKIVNHPDGDAGERPWATVRKYWLDQTASDLVGKGLLKFAHDRPGGPHVQLTEAGLAWVDACVDDSELEPLGEARYATPWLNVDVVDPAQQQLPVVSLSDTMNAMGDDEDGEGEPLVYDAQGGLTEERAAAQDAADAMDEDLLDTLVEALRDRFRETLDQPDRWSNLSTTAMASAVVTAVSHGHVLAAAEALAGLLWREGAHRCDAVLRDVVFGSGLDLTPERDTSDDDPLLFALRAGDLVQKGTSVTSFRLLRRLEDSKAFRGTEATPTFEAQTLRHGRDYGAPVRLTLDEITGLAAGAEG